VKIDLDQNMLQDVVSAAIMQSLDETKRNTMIQGAIKHLLNPEQGSYGRRESPIEQAFRLAIHSVAERVARDMLENDQRVSDGIKMLLSEALDNLLVTNRDKTVEKLADAIAAGMAYRDRDRY